MADMPQNNQSRGGNTRGWAYSAEVGRSFEDTSVQKIAVYWYDVYGVLLCGRGLKN